MIRCLGVTLSAVILVVLLAGCPDETETVLEGEKLFELGIGRLENEIDLFRRGAVTPRYVNMVTVRDGLVYIANGGANKILEFTSFGDLVRLIYDADRNPEPVSVRVEDTDENVSTLSAYEYGFSQLGYIAVDSRRRIFAEDRLSTERSVFDETLGVYLNRIVLRFDPSGEPIDYLGQEGIGGTPFPYIDSIQTNVRDELILVTKSPALRSVYLFGPEGDLIYTVRIGLDHLPLPNLEDDYIAVLEDVRPAVGEYRVYLKVSYYRAAVDPDTDKEYGIEFDHARVYWIGLESGRYDGYFELPRTGTSGEEERHYELVGTNQDEYIYLTAREDVNRTNLLIMRPDGSVVRRRNLMIPETDLVLRDLSVSFEGVLTGFLAYPDRVDVYWWRTDRILPTIGRSNGS